MKIKDAVRAMIRRRGITVDKVANMLNYKTISGLQNRLYNKNGVRSNLLCALADACEFDVILRDRLTGVEIKVDVEGVEDLPGNSKEKGYGYVTGYEGRDLED